MDEPLDDLDREFLEGFIIPCISRIPSPRFSQFFLPGRLRRSNPGIPMIGRHVLLWADDMEIQLVDQRALEDGVFFDATLPYISITRR